MSARGGLFAIDGVRRRLHDSDAIALFEELYGTSRDPWGTNYRWYERRKRALIMASLPQDHYDSIYEAGCGTGHISVELARRCTRLVASDASHAAVAIASAALVGHSNASVLHHRLPEDWPARHFDLIVFGELLYFLEATGISRLADRSRDSAGASGTVIACDWRATIEGYGHSGEEAHRRFEDALQMPRLFEYADDDFILTGWSADKRSVANREGLR